MADGKRIGYAVVGLGHIAQRAVLPAFRQAKKSRLIALVSSDGEKAKALARLYRTPYFYQDYDACLQNSEVQAVFIASVNSAHADQTVRAAARGKHVLCEKPMANTLEDCLRMIAACRRHRVRLMIAYRMYFEPTSRALKTLVRADKLGRLKIIHSAFTIRLRPGKSPAWHYAKDIAGGGSLVDVGVYPVNTIRWLVGRQPTEVSAYAWTVDRRRFREVDENIVFQLKFPGGVVAQASSSFGAAQASFLHVHGEEGWAALDPAYAYSEERCLFGKLNGRWFERRFGMVDEFALELDAFADCIRHNHDPEPNGREGARDVAIMEAIYRSARDRRPVAVPALA